jgi:hypothetical protein
MGLDIYENKGFGVTHLEKISNGVWKKSQIVNKLKEEKSALIAKAKIEPDKNKRREIRAEAKILTEKIKNVKAIPHKDNLAEFLASHPLYQEHYDRNFTLVMEEGIPDYIRANIMLEYNSADTKYNEDEFLAYLDRVGLHTIKSKLPFKSEQKLDITNCGWDF